MHAVFVVFLLAAAALQPQDGTATIRIHVQHEAEPVAAASVIVNGTAYIS